MNMVDQFTFLVETLFFTLWTRLLHSFVDRQEMPFQSRFICISAIASAAWKGFLLNASFQLSSFTFRCISVILIIFFAQACNVSWFTFATNPIVKAEISKPFIISFTWKWSKYFLLREASVNWKATSWENLLISIKNDWNASVNWKGMSLYKHLIPITNNFLDRWRRDISNFLLIVSSHKLLEFLINCLRLL